MLRLFLMACLLVLPTGSLRAESPDFDTQILPVLIDRCAACHGGGEEQSGLSVESLGHLKRGGDRGELVVPGKSGESLLFKVVTEGGDVPRMPLDDDPLTAEQLALLKQWIDAGAPGWNETAIPRRVVKSDHWAFQPVAKPTVPQIRHSHLVRTPIDAFILKRLDAEGLAPSPEADRGTLIRRLSLDLLGLIPAPDDVEQFVTDTSPDAYEQLVDRLLASPHYGERWGRHWLDAARYADSNGYTIDGARSIWPYRDWVVDALNRDLPYDQFAIEQLAGDLLPNPTTDQLIATGFHRNTLINEEGGTDREQFRVEAVVDRVSTTGTVFLGLTVACAQCHTHKFDPITQREFYQLFDVFNQCDEPNLDLPTSEQQRRQGELTAKLSAAKKAVADYDKVKDAAASVQASLDRFTAWKQQHETFWRVLPLESVAAEGKTRFEPLDDHSWLVRDPENHETYILEFTAPVDNLRGLRLEALTHESIPGTGPGLTAHGNFTLNEVSLETANGKPLPLLRADADFAQANGPAAAAIDGDVKTFWAVSAGNKTHSDREIQFFLDADAQIPQGTKLRLKLRQEYENSPYLIGRFRVSATSAPDSYLHLPLLTRRPWEQAGTWDETKFTAEIKSELQKLDPQRKSLEDAVAVADRELKAVNAQITRTMILRRKAEPRTTHVHIRGDFLRHGSEVRADVLGVLHPLPEGVEHPDRLQFARWLFDPANPLTPRVTVNRVWQQFFGLGLVETENDFGTQGSPPSHPELLDWLSGELIRQEWKMKSLHRLIVTSHVYRQSSSLRPELIERDPRNRLLARQSRIRLEAEAIRDVALDSAGLLFPAFGGPGVYPPQPGGLDLFTQVKKSWNTEAGPHRYRRGLYTYLWRSNIYPLFPTFDAPGATMACTRRTRSNTPLQALTLANDAAFVEMAQALARRVLTEGPEYDEGRLRFAWQLCFSRDPSAEELSIMSEFLARQKSAYADETEAKTLSGPTLLPQATPADQAAWTATARVLMNLDEFITRE